MSRDYFRDTVPFLADLAAHNDRAWFEAHRDRYQAAYVDAAREFVQAMAPRLAELDPQAACEPRINGSIRRIHRDTRFSRDKTPYKTHLGLIFYRGSDKTAGYVLHLGPRGMMVGGGRYKLGKAELQAWRDRVDQQGEAIAAMFDQLRARGYTQPEPELKRVPKPYAPDHPHGELLRRKAIITSVDLELPETGLLDLVTDHFRRLRPLVDLVASL